MDFEGAKQALTAVARDFAGRGWCPATSGNFSVRDPRGGLVISRSGLDKGRLETDGLLAVAGDGSCEGEGRPSAETALHRMIYECTSAQAVLHTHSLLGTVVSLRALERGEVRFSGLEVLKGLAGYETHEDEAVLPVFENSQDMSALAECVRQKLLVAPRIWGFLLAGHGLYAWGRSVSEARRHAESYEFLLQCWVQLQGWEGR